MYSTTTETYTKFHYTTPTTHLYSHSPTLTHPHSPTHTHPPIFTHHPPALTLPTTHPPALTHPPPTLTHTHSPPTRPHTRLCLKAFIMKVQRLNFNSLVEFMCQCACVCMCAEHAVSVHKCDVYMQACSKRSPQVLFPRK